MNSIFESTPTQHGHSLTITSVLGHILTSAESAYGERDKSYTILGVEFTTDKRPRIWYPGSCKHIIIQITNECRNDLNRAVFQVAHEAIHCLSPTGSKQANVLEEGLATLFSVSYCAINGYHSNWSLGVPEYINAFNKVQKLINVDGEIIKKARQVQPSISSIDSQLLQSLNPSIPTELADDVTADFVYPH